MDIRVKTGYFDSKMVQFASFLNNKTLLSFLKEHILTFREFVPTLLDDFE